MSIHVSSLDTSLQTTYAWLDDLARIGEFFTADQAYAVLRSVLHTLRDALTVDEAAHLGAQMPIVVRGLFYEGWKPSTMPRPMRTMDEFLDCVRDRLANPRIDPVLACRAVFTLLERRISAGEISDVRHMLNQHVRPLWPERRAQPTGS